MMSPAENSRMSLGSCKTKCPPLLKLNMPRAQTTHQPNARFWRSQWDSHTVCGPMLPVTAAKGNTSERENKSGYCVRYPS